MKAGLRLVRRASAGRPWPRCCPASRKHQGPASSWKSSWWPKVERDGFEAALSNFGETPLFHKADLSNGGEEVLKEIAGSKRVVGVVVNAIDDLLSDGDQVKIVWNLDSIAHVRTLLAASSRV